MVVVRLAMPWLVYDSYQYAQELSTELKDTIMATLAQKQRARRQMRGFIIIWTFITMVMGLATFLAIYFTYRLPSEDGTAVALSNQTNGGNNPVVVVPSNTPLPTEPPTATPVLTETPVAVAQAATEVPTNTPGPTNTPQPLPDEDETFQVGIQVQVPPDLNVDVTSGFLRSVSQDLGLDWVKKQVRWEVFEPERGLLLWDELDLFMSEMRFWQIKPMLSIVTAPDWAREPGANLSEHGPPANNADYVDFVRAILTRYDDQVFAIEVWNEQNIDREWTSVNGLSARNYVSLLRDTYNMVQEVSPGTIVISGALSPTGLNDGVGAFDDFVYMQAMIDAGMLDVTDCVGAHHNGYNIGPRVPFDAVPNDPSATFRGPFDNPHHSWSFRSTLDGYATRIANAGRDTKLCVTEFGWASTAGLSGKPQNFEFADDNTLQEQADYIVDALAFMEESGYVWQAYIWNFNYGPLAGWNPSNDNVPYSLIGPGNEFRPAYDAIREWHAEYLQRTGQA